MSLMAGHQKARSTLPVLGFLWVVYEVAAEVEQRWSSPVIKKKAQIEYSNINLVKPLADTVIASPPLTGASPLLNRLPQKSW